MGQKPGKHITDQLKAEIEGSTLTGAEICRKCKISKSIMSRFLNGEQTPTLATVARIANAIGYELKLVKVKGS